MIQREKQKERISKFGYYSEIRIVEAGIVSNRELSYHGEYKNQDCTNRPSMVHR